MQSITSNLGPMVSRRLVREKVNEVTLKRRAKMRRICLLILASTLFCRAPHAFADSVSVTYKAVHLNGSAWEYDYSLTGTLTVGDDVAVYFPIGSSSTLTDLGTGGTNWSTFVLQPDSLLPADGEYDMVATASSPSLSPLFSVTFQYLGAGTPGSQAFTLYDSNFATLASGTTLSPSIASPVPEPGTIVLLSSGLAMLWSMGRRVSLRR